MPIQFTCPCGQTLQARDEHAGRMTRCPACGREVPIPGGAIAVQPLPAEPSRPTREAVTREPARRERDWDAEEPPAPAKQRTSGRAIAALIFSLVSLGAWLCVGVPSLFMDSTWVFGIVCAGAWLLASIPAVILSLMGLSQIKQGRGRVGGKGLAITGLILGLVTMFLCPCLSVYPAYSKTQDAAARITSQNNLKQLGIAMHTYNDTYNKLPPAVVYDQSGKPLYSWRVLILPYIEQDNLYKQFKLDEPWDSPHNKRLLTPMPKTFALPGKKYEDKALAGLTYYQVFDGQRAAFDSDLTRNGRHPIQLGFPGQPVIESGFITRIPASFPDGTSNTFLVAEAADPVEWSKPADLKFDPTGPLPRLGSHWSGNRFQVVMADGMVQSVAVNTDEKVLRGYITASGGETPGELK